VSQQSVGDQWDTVASEWRAHQRLGAIARTIELEADLQICSNRFTCGDGSPSWVMAAFAPHPLSFHSRRSLSQNPRHRACASPQWWFAGTFCRWSEDRDYVAFPAYGISLPQKTKPIADCSGIKKAPALGGQGQLSEEERAAPHPKTGASTTEIVHFICGLFAWIRCQDFENLFAWSGASPAGISRACVRLDPSALYIPSLCVLVKQLYSHYRKRDLFCPICRSAVLELDRTGDATGYACATHGNFKVTDTVFAQRAKDYTREQWEAALRKAKQRTKSGEMPVIN
jgi:hypothetical protein